MAATDVIALDHNFDQWKKTRGDGLTGINFFDYYVFENFLKAFPVSDKEIMAGAVDNSKDGGVDGFYFFANRKYVFDDIELDPQSEYKFNLVIFQCKEGEGFSPVEMGKFVLFVDDLLDPHRQESAYQSLYHTKLKSLMKIFKDQYYQVAGSLTSVEIDFVYVSKLDVTLPKPDEDVTSVEAKLAATISKHFPKAAFTMNYVNAAKLLDQIRLRRRNEKSLVYMDSIVTKEGWIALVSLPEFYKFLLDAHGNFHEQMLEENVRGFQNKTSVNDGIKKTLNEPTQSAEFWLLNNGVTVVTDELTQAPQATIKVKDPQIVNGLQTSRQVYDYYKSSAGVTQDDKRRIVIRVIEAKDEAIRDQIVNATNSQNKMPAEALRATEPIQRKIEEVFATFGLFYDRRPGHHKDKGRPAAKIVSVREVLQASLAVARRLPDAARARPRDYLKDDDKYAEVYLNEKVPLTVHVKSTELVRRVESFAAKQEHQDHMLDLQFYVALIVAARALGNAHVPPHELAALNVSTISDSIIAKAFDDAFAAYIKHGGDDKASKGPKMRTEIVEQLQGELHGKKG